MESKVGCETVENKLETTVEESGADNLHMAKSIDSQQMGVTLVDSGPLESVEVDSCVTINNVTSSRPDDSEPVNCQITKSIFPKTECEWMNFSHYFGIILSFYWIAMFIVGNIFIDDLPMPVRISWILGATYLPRGLLGLRLTQLSKSIKYMHMYTALSLVLYSCLSALSFVLFFQMINVSCHFMSANKFDAYLFYHLPLLVSFLGLIPTLFSIENIMAGKLRYMRKLSKTSKVYNFGNFQKFRYMNICFITISYWLLASAMTRVYAYEGKNSHYSTVLSFAAGGFMIFGDRALDILLKCRSKEMFGYFLYVQKQAVIDLIAFCIPALLHVAVNFYLDTIDLLQRVSIVIDSAAVGVALGVSVLTYLDCHKLIWRLEQNRGKQYLLVLRELYKY